MLWISISKRSFCIHLCAFFCYQHFFIFSHITQHSIQNITKQNNRHILNISKSSQKVSVCIFAGLRTLCFAVVDISESSYQQWLEVYHRASTSLQNRALKMEESYELIEKVRYPNSFSSVHRWGGLHPKITEPTRTALCSPCCTKTKPLSNCKGRQYIIILFFIFLYVCIYVYMYVCMCVYVCVYVCVCIYIYIYTVSHRSEYTGLYSATISVAFATENYCARLWKNI